MVGITTRRHERQRVSDRSRPDGFSLNTGWDGRMSPGGWEAEDPEGEGPGQTDPAGFLLELDFTRPCADGPGEGSGGRLKRGHAENL